MNTLKTGKVRYITFKEKDIWYAVALEFNIVVTGDDEGITLFNLFDAMAGYVAAVGKIKGSKDYYSLNQEADTEYEMMWSKKDEKVKKGVKSPFVSNYGVKFVNM
jgi:hypothetical protein